MASDKIRYILPVLLAGQTAAIVLITRYTRTQKVDGPRYLPSTVVLLAECVKCITSLLIIFYQCALSLRKIKSELYNGLLANPISTLKIAIPSGIYAIQNNLLFVALSHLDAPTYQVTYQLKILTTAMFSVVLMKKRLTLQQWCSLFMLVVGVVCVQYPANDKTTTPVESRENSDRMIGLIVLLIACTSSGFAGVYFEYLLKSSNVSLVMRNVQMAGFGIIFSSIGMLCNDGEKLMESGLLQGYNASVCVVLLLQAYGGLIVSTVIKYMDNLVKVFAASLSMIVSSFVSYFIFQDFILTELFVIGAILVISATFLYGYRAAKKTSPLKFAAKKS